MHAFTLSQFAIVELLSDIYIDRPEHELRGISEHNLIHILVSNVTSTNKYCIWASRRINALVIHINFRLNATLFTIIFT
jgi:hypothetical protein